MVQNYATHDKFPQLNRFQLSPIGVIQKFVMKGNEIINLMNCQRWSVGKKIISHKEAHEDEIVNYSLKVVLEILRRIINSHVEL